MQGSIGARVQRVTAQPRSALGRPWETSQLHLEPQRQKRGLNSRSQLLNHVCCLPSRSDCTRAVEKVGLAPASQWPSVGGENQDPFIIYDTQIRAPGHGQLLIHGILSMAVFKQDLSRPRHVWKAGLILPAFHPPPPSHTSLPVPDRILPDPLPPWSSKVLPSSAHSLDDLAALA
ncbi:hypothetical protein MHYP_G00156740 [Metynnis hypsauchen]